MNEPFIWSYHKIIKPWDKSPEFLQDRSPVRMVVTGIPMIEKLSATVHASKIRSAFSATFFGRYRQHHPWNNSVTTMEKDKVSGQIGLWFLNLHILGISWGLDSFTITIIWFESPQPAENRRSRYLNNFPSFQALGTNPRVSRAMTNPASTEKKKSPWKKR